MRRLYLKIYLAFLGVVVFCLIVSIATARFFLESFGEVQPPVHALVQFVADELSPSDAPTAVLQQELEALRERLLLDFALRGADGRLLAVTDADLPAPEMEGAASSWFGGRHFKGLHVRLNDGRWLTAGAQRPHPPFVDHIPMLAVLLAAIALGCYPVARRITRRLEQLQTGVENWGAGDLAARVSVGGRDEVAELAASFNEAARRIEALMQQEKRVLANASHELRSPLTRLRMALELLAEGSESAEHVKLVEGAAQDIEELDELIEEVLLASRIEAAARVERAQQVDLTALLRMEAQRVGATVSGAEVTITGDPSLLKRMLRNLLENAHRYSEEIEASVGRGEAEAIIVVADRGPGVPEAERERIFERFYRPPYHREGTHGAVGLGLALVKQIAELHGGSAKCLPRRGGGSRFEVRLKKSSTQRRRGAD